MRELIRKFYVYLDTFNRKVDIAELLLDTVSNIVESNFIKFVINVDKILPMLRTVSQKKGD